MKRYLNFGRTYLGGLTLLLIFSLTALAQTNPTNRLRYSQAANGRSGSQTYVTTLLVSNPHNFAIQAYIETFDDANPSNSMNMGFATNCTFDPTTNDFTIPASASCLFASDGGDNHDGTWRPLKTGWLRATEVSGNNAIGGYLIFTAYQGTPVTGFPLYTVGVSPTPIFDQFSIPVVRDVSSNQDIGFAMANPFGDGPTTMVAQLVDSSTGTVVEQTNITLNTLGHAAQYLSQLFPNTLGNASHFVGNLFVTAQTQNFDGAIATALIQQGNQFGGAPPTSNSILVAKRSDSFNLRESTGGTHEHEKLTSTLVPRLF